MADRSAKDPCVKICKFDAAGLCRGCFRTKAEVRGWKRLPDDVRRAVLARVRPLMDAAGKGGGERLRTLDRKIAKLERKLEALRAERGALV